MKLFTELLFDFFLPRFCSGCNKKLTAGEKPICSECLNSILIADEDRIRSEFNRKFLSRDLIKEFYSHFVFEKDKILQDIIHSLKYKKQFRTGIYLGEILSEGIKARNWQIDLILPIPLHHLKKAERGFNQSDFIAKGLSRRLKIPYSTNSIKRIRFTESQTNLDIEERQANVAKAFRLRSPNKIAGKTILLVDDVITTGATILECGKVLVSAGVKSVYACSIAIAD